MTHVTSCLDDLLGMPPYTETMHSTSRTRVYFVVQYRSYFSSGINHSSNFLYGADTWILPNYVSHLMWPIIFHSRAKSLANQSVDSTSIHVSVSARQILKLHQPTSSLQALSASRYQESGLRGDCTAYYLPCSLWIFEPLQPLPVLLLYLFSHCVKSIRRYTVAFSRPLWRQRWPLPLQMSDDEDEVETKEIYQRYE
jgi:hypothetical protein